MTRLALVRQRYNPFGGAERFVERALQALADQGLAVTLLTREWQDAPADRDVRILNPYFLGRTWRDAGFARAVQAIVAAGEFDLVQSHERIPGCAVYRAGDGVHATWLEQRGRARSALSRWFTPRLPWHRYTLNAEARMFRHPALRAVICNSHMVRDDIVRRFGVDPARLHVIHNGVDLEQFHPGLREEHRSTMRKQLGIPDEAKVILFLGSGFERKGVPQLLEAAARIQGRDVRVLVVGHDKKADQMREMAAGLGLAERVYFAGGQKDVRPWYGCADLFVLPTLYDPFPNAALEALACGLPTVTSTASGAAEIVDENCGGVCDALDTQALAAHCERLLAADAVALAARARAVAAGLGRADMAARLIALYQALLGQSTPESPAPPKL